MRSRLDSKTEGVGLIAYWQFTQLFREVATAGVQRHAISAQTYNDGMLVG